MAAVVCAAECVKHIAISKILNTSIPKFFSTNEWLPLPLIQVDT